MSGQNVTVEHLPTMSARLAGRNLWFLLFWFLSLVLFHLPLSSLVSLSFHDERYSHVVLIPIISLLLLWLERRRIFLESKYCLFVGTPLLLLGVVVYSIGKVRAPALGLNDSLSVMVFGMVSTMDRWVRSLLWDAILSRGSISIVLSALDDSHTDSCIGQYRSCLAKGLFSSHLRPL